jgi:hypothetical protein
LQIFGQLEPHFRTIAASPKQMAQENFAIIFLEKVLEFEKFTTFAPR